MPVVRNGWGQDNPANRQLFTGRFIPDGSELESAVTPGDPAIPQLQEALIEFFAEVLSSK